MGFPSFIAQTTAGGMTATAVCAAVAAVAGAISAYYSAPSVARRVAEAVQSEVAPLKLRIEALQAVGVAQQATIDTQSDTIHRQGQTIVNLQTQNNDQQSQINNMGEAKKAAEVIATAKALEVESQRRLKHDCRGKLSACGLVIHGYRKMPLGQADFDTLDLATLGDFPDKLATPKVQP